MSTLILDKVLSGYNLAKVNDNFERIEKAFNEALLHRDGSKELTDDLDVNSQKLLNVGGIEIGGVDIAESISQLQEEWQALFQGIAEYKAAADEILKEAISYGAVDQKNIGNAQRVFTTSSNYAANSNLTLPLPYIVGKNTLKLNLGHYYDMFNGVDYEEVGTAGSTSTTIKLLRPISSGAEIEEFVDGSSDLYSIYTTAEALQTLLTTSYSPESISAFVDAVSDIEELGLEDKIEQLNAQYEQLVAYSTALQTTVADINTKYSTITDMYEDMGTKYSLLETLYPQLLALLSDTDFDLDDLNSAIGDLNDAIEDINDAMEDIQGYAESASDDATAAASSASDASDSATAASNSASSAAGALTNAQIWAEGTDGQVETLGGEHSAKGWAEQAETVQSAVKYVSQSLTSTQKTQARTNIGAFNINDGVTATGSTTARTLANRFADVVNVKDFGAKGDGVTDDTAAFTSAANSKGTSNPVQVYIPAGTYKLESDPITPAQYSNAARKIFWYIDAAASFTGTGKLCNYPIYMGEYPDWYSVFLQTASPNRTGSIPNSMRVIQTDGNPITRTALTLCTQTKQGLVNSDYAGFQSLVVNNNTTTKSRAWSGYFETSRTTDVAGSSLGIEITIADASPSGSSNTSPYGPLTTSEGADVEPYHSSICLWMGGGGELEGLTQNDITAFIGTANGGSKAKLGIVIGDNSIVTDSDGYANALALPSGYGIRWWSDKTTKTAGIRCSVTTGVATELSFADNLTRFSYRNASNTLISVLQLNHPSREYTAGLVITPAKSEGPVLEPVGTATNADIRLRGKGTGLVRYGTYTAGVLTPTGYITIKDIGGTQRRLLVG